MDNQQAVPKYVHEGMHPDDTESIAQWVIDKFMEWCKRRDFAIIDEPYRTEHHTIRARIMTLENPPMRKRVWFDGRRWRLA